MRIFRRPLSREAQLFAEAQASLEQGAALADVLARYPDDAGWLAPLLRTSIKATEVLASVDADPEFKYTLRSGWLAAARRPSLGIPSRPALSWLPTAIAASMVVAVVAAFGVMTFAFVTADRAVPGDWNYSLKEVRERVEYQLAHGRGRVDVQIRQTEARVYEIQRLNERGDLSAGDIEKLDREARTLTDLARERELDEIQRRRLKGILDGANVVLEEARTRQPALDTAVTSARKTVDEAVVATGAGAVTTLPDPTPPASPTAPANAPTAAPTPSSTPSGGAVSPTPTQTPTSEPQAPLPTPTVGG